MQFSKYESCRQHNFYVFDCTEAPFTDSSKHSLFSDRDCGTPLVYNYNCAKSFAEKFYVVNSRDPLLVLGNSAFPQYKAKLWSKKARE